MNKELTDREVRRITEIESFRTVEVYTNNSGSFRQTYESLYRKGYLIRLPMWSQNGLTGYRYFVDKGSER